MRKGDRDGWETAGRATRGCGEENERTGTVGASATLWSRRRNECTLGQERVGCAMVSSWDGASKAVLVARERGGGMRMGACA